MKCWYFVTVEYCPICAHDRTTRERRYTARPERWEDRHEIFEVWDGCGAF